MNLFFPSHDIALGNGVKHINPPKAAQMLQEDLAWLEEIFAADHLQPWGWNWDSREYLAKEHHIDRKDLPTDEQLEHLRQLSNRRTTIDLLKALHFEGQMPQYLENEKDIDRYIEQEDAYGRPFVLKTPWSSSGRGLIRSEVTPRPLMRQRALATLHKMGGIMAEHWFKKKQDFALLFYIGREKVSFLGYSLFDNEQNGTYRQGYLMSNQAIEEIITQPDNNQSYSTFNKEQLHTITGRAEAFLTDLFRPYFGLPWEVGYLGIDMMTLDEPDLTWACCEINLRCTMGIVARLWADEHLKEGQQGRFVISPMDVEGHFKAQFLVP